MDEQQALLAAVIADPADDTVRLAMADWFQEHGEAKRAEFIRRQINNPDSWPLAKPKRRLKGGGYPLCREEVLHRSALPGWKLCGWNPEKKQVCYQRPYGEGPDRDVLGVRFARGFASQIEVSTKLFLRSIDQLLRQQPVETVVFRDEPIPDQDSDHLWFPGREPFDKFESWGGSPSYLSGYTVPQALHHYWPKLRFEWNRGTRWRYVLEKGKVERFDLPLRIDTIIANPDLVVNFSDHSLNLSIGSMVYFPDGRQGVLMSAIDDHGCARVRIR